MDKEYILVTELKDINSIKEKLKHFIQEQTKRYHKRFEKYNHPCHLFARIWLGGHPFSMPHWRVAEESGISENKLHYLDSIEKLKKLGLDAKRLLPIKGINKRSPLSYKFKNLHKLIMGALPINLEELDNEGELGHYELKTQHDIEEFYGIKIAYLPINVEDLEVIFVPGWEKRFVAVHIDKILKYFDDKKMALDIIKSKDTSNMIEGNYLIDGICILFDKLGLSKNKPLKYSHGIGVKLDFSFNSNAFTGRSLSDEEYKRCIKDRFVFTILSTYDEAYLYFCLLAKFFGGKIYAGDKSSTLWLKEWIQEVESITDIEKQIINQKIP